MSEDDLEELHALPRTSEPPPGLENRIVARLSEEGLIRPRRRRWPSFSGRRALVAAAAVALFLAGWGAGRFRPTVGKAPRFALLLYDGSDFQGSESHAREYAAWAGSLRRSGISVSGEELTEVSRRISGSRATGVESETLSGFFVVEAPDLAAAESIARTCPHLRHRGVVAVRPIAGG